jgi:dipeptidyl aminopeptidase/acylaminoacyl peptidase
MKPKLLSFRTKSCILILALMTIAPLMSQSAIPIENFFKESDYGEMALSPDGSKLAVAARYEERLALAVIDMKTKRPQILTAPKNFDVAGIFWVGNSRIIFSGIRPGDKFMPKSLDGGIYAIDADGKNSKTLCESGQQQVNRGVRTLRYADVLSRYGKSTDEILIVYNERREQDPDVYRMDVRTGSKRMVAENPDFISEYKADHNGIVRIGYGVKEKNRYIIYRDTAKDEWRELRRWQFDNDPENKNIVPLAFDEKNELIYVRVLRGKAQTQSIALFDPKKNEIVKDLFKNETYDISDVMLEKNTYRLLGYGYEGARGHVYIYTDKRYAELQVMIDQELAGMKNELMTSSDDDTWRILYSHSDRDPGAYYLFNTKDLTLEKLIKPREWIKPEQMAEMRPIEYKSRDGMTIHGYITLPVGVEPRNMPMIVNPHGGPWHTRDVWGFNPEVQFLANRGYAVLQMNFRVSAGYGRKFELAGYGQWGLAMQDDVTDAVKWAVAQGYADPKRIAIYGASYGGFATMAGLAFTPELYRCGINYVGVTDVKLLLKRMNRSWERIRPELEAMAGNAKVDSEKLDRTSPMKNADLIKAPVFFAYGELDPRVDLKHGTRFISKLKSNGIPVEVMIKNNEEHGFRNLRNQVEFYSTMERFLAKYMN